MRTQIQIHVMSHVPRRMSVILSLRNGMDVLHLQTLLGQAGLETVTHYTQMVDEDLLRAHKPHPPWITCEEGRLLRAQDNDNENDDRCNKHQIRINCRFHAYMILGSREGPVKYVKVS